MQSIKRGSRFISYAESYQFSRTLDQLLEQIEMLLTDDPKAAFEQADLFMATHEKVYNRCDDSGGSVGDSYREALRVRLEAAAAWQAGSQPCKLDWSAEVLKRHNNNDYAVWDYLISGSLGVLGEEPLREMASQFEQNIKRLSSAGNDGYNAKLSRARLGLRAVAEALGDVVLFECCYLLGGAVPNELQKEKIIEFCLAQKDAEAALEWLAGEWQTRFTSRQQTLKDAAYVMLSRRGDLLELRREAYNSEPSFERLHSLLEVAPDAEREALQADAASRASSSQSIIVAVETLIKLQEMGAVSAYVLLHPEKLHDVSYYGLAEWAQRFEEGGINLAAVQVYRVLLLDILQAGRTKAYRHAAKYYKALNRLDTKLEAYSSVVGKKEFEQELRADHGLKRSFWSLVS